jgi:hypothetical protein
MFYKRKIKSPFRKGASKRMSESMNYIKQEKRKREGPGNHTDDIFRHLTGLVFKGVAAENGLASRN